MLMVMLSLIALASCTIGDDLPTDAITTTTMQTTIAPPSTKKEVYTYPKEYIPGSIELVNLPPEYDEFNLFQGPYRFIYKNITDEYAEIVGQEVCEKWLVEEVVRDRITDDPIEMMLVSFVKYFNIPKQDFVLATEKLREHSLDSGFDLSEEEYELPNPDIVYTFDNKIIDEYYRKE
jgi:hypothetical protein